MTRKAANVLWQHVSLVCSSWCQATSRKQQKQHDRVIGVVFVSVILFFYSSGLVSTNSVSLLQDVQLVRLSTGFPLPCGTRGSSSSSRTEYLSFCVRGHEWTRHMILTERRSTEMTYLRQKKLSFNVAHLKNVLML